MMVRGNDRKNFGADATVPVGFRAGPGRGISGCLPGKAIARSWTRRRQGLVDVRPAGHSVVPPDELVDSTVAAGRTLQ